LNNDIIESKRRLPLVELMRQLGKGEHASTNAHCPFHDDKAESFLVYRNNQGELRWKCKAGCGQGDEITFLEKHYGISNKEATKRFLEMAGAPNEQTFNLGSVHAQALHRTQAASTQERNGKGPAQSMTADAAMQDGHETVLLAALMNGGEPLPVRQEDFSSPNRLIFNAIEGLTNRGLLAVCDELDRRKQLVAAGGRARLTEISCLAHDPANVEHALGEVLEASRRREAIAIGKQLVSGEITPDEAQKQLTQPAWRRAGEKSWNVALAESSVSSTQLQSLELVPRKKLLGDWFCEGDCGFLYAFRGVGKTWFALAMAQALSSGGRLGEWQAHEPVKVLYIDSEMPADLMRERSIGLGTNENFQIINHEILFDRTGKVLNIADPEIQNSITKYCVDTGRKAMAINNLSTAAFGLKENEADSWERVLPWLLDLRRRKIAVVLEHHAGRSGEMRGTSKREDSVFWIIALDDMKKNADDKRGARFISRFTKPSRNTQEEVPAFEWHFVTEESGQVTIGCKQAQTLDVFRSHIESGVTKCDEIADAMNLPKYAVSRLAKKAMDAGWLKKGKGHEYVPIQTT
jgi:putative DNA primase/helicase